MKSTLHSDIANFVIKPIKFSILPFKSLLYFLHSLSVLNIFVPCNSCYAQWSHYHLQRRGALFLESKDSNWECKVGKTQTVRSRLLQIYLIDPGNIRFSAKFKDCVNWGTLDKEYVKTFQSQERPCQYCRAT